MFFALEPGRCVFVCVFYSFSGCVIGFVLLDWTLWFTRPDLFAGNFEKEVQHGVFSFVAAQWTAPDWFDEAILGRWKVAETQHATAKSACLTPIWSQCLPTAIRRALCVHLSIPCHIDAAGIEGRCRYEFYLSVDWLTFWLSIDCIIIYLLFIWFFNHNFCFTFQPRQLLSMSRCWAWKSPAHCRVAGGQSPRRSASTRSWPNSTLSSAWSPKTTPWTPPSLARFSSSFSTASPPTLSIFWCRARKRALLSWEFKFGKKLRVNAAIDRLIIYAFSSHSSDWLIDWLFLAYCAHSSGWLIDWLLDLEMSLLCMHWSSDFCVIYLLIHLSMSHVWIWFVYRFIFRLSLWLAAEFCNFVFYQIAEPISARSTTLSERTAPASRAMTLCKPWERSPSAPTFSKPARRGRKTSTVSSTCRDIFRMLKWVCSID